MEANSSIVRQYQPKYDGFLSFRGEDTRNSFVSHLYRALKKKGINVFIDDRCLEKGKSIKEDLLEAIEGSQLAVIVLSKNYASSSWCLEELVKIIECQIQREQTHIIPIFYGINDSEKGILVDKFSEAFGKGEQERMQCLMKCLTEAMESGWDVAQYRDEAQCIEKVVEEIVSKLERNKSLKTKTSCRKLERNKSLKTNSSMLTSCQAEAVMFERGPLQHLSSHLTNSSSPFFFFFLAKTSTINSAQVSDLEKFVLSHSRLSLYCFPSDDLFR